MKNSQTIRELLGFTQLELAQLLKVSRSQFANYESGARSLPLPSMQLLAEMVTYVQAPKKEAINLPHQAKQLHKKQLQILRLLKENEYQQLVVSRKLAALQKKYTAKLNVLQLVAYLTNNGSKAIAPGNDLLKTIANKATKELNKQGIATLYTYELKQELLHLEKLLLDAELRKLTGNPDQVRGKE